MVLRNMYKSIGNIKITAAFLTGCFFLLSCNLEEEQKKINKDAAGRDEAVNVRINYSIGGKRKAVLTSPLMYRLINENMVEFPKTIHVDFYNEVTGELDSKLDAKYAKYQDGKATVFLKDSVRVINTKGDTLYCKTLNWDRSKTDHEFFTDDTVRIRQKMQIIDGVGMDAKQDFKEWYIIKPIGFIKVPAAEFPN